LKQKLAAISASLEHAMYSICARWLVDSGNRQVDVAEDQKKEEIHARITELQVLLP